MQYVMGNLFSFRTRTWGNWVFWLAVPELLPLCQPWQLTKPRFSHLRNGKTDLDSLWSSLAILKFYGQHSFPISIIEMLFIALFCKLGEENELINSELILQLCRLISGMPDIDMDVLQIVIKTQLSLLEKVLQKKSII